MSMKLDVIREDLSDFCKITKTVRDEMSRITGSDASCALLLDGWKHSFESKGYQIKGGGHSITFTFETSGSEGQDVWVEVLLKESREGDPLPYWTCAVTASEEAPREADSLAGFAFVREELYEELAAMALEEPWTFGGVDNDLLKYYLNGTFLRLMDEEKLGYAADSEGDMCVWCTGLVNAHYEDIFCFCVPNDRPGARQKWLVQGFCASGSTHLGQRIRRAFGSEPPLRASYLEDIADTVYDGNLDLAVNFEHIFQRIHRIGMPALRVLLASSRAAMEVIGRAEAEDPAAREGVLKELNDVVTNDIILQQSLHNALSLAAERARARARYMYTSALPSWNPRGSGSIAFCLPLCLVVEERVDTVLLAQLVKDAKEPFYEGKTIFDIQMAYRTARIVQRTDGMTGWVSSAFIGNETEEEHVVSAFAAPSRSATPSLAHAPGIGATPITGESSVGPILPALPRAKLKPISGGYPPLLVCGGDTIGFVRRPDDEHPRIELPVEKEFYAVSQSQGAFSESKGTWSYTHFGANWSQIRGKDGSVTILEEKKSSAPIEFGDMISFAGSPEYRFEPLHPRE